MTEIIHIIANSLPASGTAPAFIAVAPHIADISTVAFALGAAAPITAAPIAAVASIAAHSVTVPCAAALSAAPAVPAIVAAALAALAAAAAALAAALWQRRRAKHILNRLDQMLDMAIAGTFTEQHFDESLLSSVESKFARYLAANAVSAGKLREEKESIQTLIADISHQTKTPVANILLYAQLLEEQVLSPEGRECAAALESQVEKLRALVDALVKTSRLEAGILSLHPKAGLLSPMLEDAAAQFAPKAAEKGITLTLTPTDAAAVFDPKWTAEAICNLLDNAVKYTPAGGSVTVEVIPYPMFCRINVTDSGPGIPETERTKIFGRFYRSPTAYETEGVGLGLYLARHIAEGQGGYIKVSSTPGQQCHMKVPSPPEQCSCPKVTSMPEQSDCTRISAQPGPGSCFSLYLPRGLPQTLSPSE